MDELPLWVKYVQAVAVVFIAGVGAWIAYRQMRIADAKLEHDLYEKRYRVYDATRKMLAEVVANNNLTMIDLRAFVLGTGDAIFLFDDALAQYLAAMRKSAVEFQAVKETAAQMPEGVEKSKALKVCHNHIEWMYAQLDGLSDKFKPFLKLSRQQRTGGPWWRRQIARWR